MKTQAEDTSPEAERVLIKLLRAASPARKMAMVLSATGTARELALTGLRERHPEASPEELRRRLADLWLGKYLAAKAYGSGPSDSSVEDTVLAKLEWFRKGGEISDRHWRDLLGVLKVQADSLDRAWLAHWAAELGISDLLQRALDEAGLARPAS